MNIPDVREKWTGGINEVVLGATRAEGGTRDKVIRIGGGKTIPLMRFEGDIGHPPVIAMDVLDVAPEDWPAPLLAAIKDVAGNPAAWAKRCVEDWGADLVCIKLDGLDPDGANHTAEQAVETVLKVKEAVGCPLIVWGCGDHAKDNEAMPKISQALKGERALLGCAEEKNYKTITAVCLADGHNLITLSPLDINIQKQVNILVSDMGFPLDRIVIFPTTGALGYGLEYTYSIQERGRIAALTGDKMMAMPVICDTGYESWRAKEAKSADAPEWGPQELRGPIWETVTATTLMQAGVDIIRTRSPQATAAIRRAIARFYG